MLRKLFVLLVILYFSHLGILQNNLAFGKKTDDSKSAKPDPLIVQSEADTCGGVLADSYKGVGFCLSCHSDKAMYMDTMHPKKVQGPPSLDATPVLTTLVDGKEVSIFDPRTKGYDTYVGPWSKYFNQENVAYTIGSHWKQQFMTRIVPAEVEDVEYKGSTTLPEGDYAVMGIQWNVSKQRWEDFRGPAGKKHQWHKSSRLTRKKCTGCHTTGFEPEDGTWIDKDSSFMQKGVSCESCHRSMMGDKKIIHPAKDLDFIEQFELCGSCHGRGASVGANGQKGSYGFPYSERLNRCYQPGDRLADFFTQTTSSKNLWPNGYTKKNHQQYSDALLGKHFEAEVGCINCHETHSDKNSHQTKLEGDKLCVSCHEEISSESALKQHSNHTPDEAGCIDCHMPYIAKRVNSFDTRSHTFEIIPPSETIAGGGDPNGFSGSLDTKHIPNSCNSSCHNGHGTGLSKTNTQAQIDLELIRIQLLDHTKQRDKNITNEKISKK